MVAFIPIERQMLIRWCWNAEAEEFATEGKPSISIATEWHGKTLHSEPDAWATVGEESRSRRLTRKQDTYFRAGCVSDGNTQPFPMISLLYKNPKPRIFTAKTLSTLRSSRQVRISCLPLRSLRLRGEIAFKRVRTKRSSRHLATLISRLWKHTARKQTVAYASDSEKYLRIR